VQLTRSSFHDLDPSYFPDGKTVAFGRQQIIGQSTSIKLLDINTGQLQTVSGSEGICCPRWSPDGRYVSDHEEHFQG